MDKPFVLLKKVKTTDNVMNRRAHESGDLMETDDLNSNSNSNDSMSLDKTTNAIKTTTEYIIQAVIKRKILFNKRPRPIILTDFSNMKFKN
jgi:hypothetical protein